MKNNEFIKYLYKLNVDLDFRNKSQNNPPLYLTEYISDPEIQSACMEIGGHSKANKVPEDKIIINNNFTVALTNANFNEDYIERFDTDKTQKKIEIGEGIEVVSLLNFLYEVCYDEAQYQAFVEKPEEYVSNFKINYYGQEAVLSSDVSTTILDLIKSTGSVKLNSQEFFDKLYQENVISNNLTENANIIW